MENIDESLEMCSNVVKNKIISEILYLDVCVWDCNIGKQLLVSLK